MELRLIEPQNPEDYREFIANFDRLFSQARLIDEEWLKEYSLSWKKPRWIVKTTTGLQKSMRSLFRVVHRLKHCII